jgi:O-acetyl-ADP-ribose deacetylase (regulator of RNase III)
VFNYAKTHNIVHCISKDGQMGLGFAKDVHIKYPIVKKKVQENQKSINIGDCYSIKWGDIYIFNLITKEAYYHKPNKSDFIKSVEKLALECEFHKIEKLVMPRIGCGLDKLNWDFVLPILQKELSGIKEVLVCIKE